MSVKSRSAGSLRHGAVGPVAALALLALLTGAAVPHPAAAQQDPAWSAAERPTDPAPADAVLPTPAPRSVEAPSPVGRPETTPEARHASLSPLGMFLGADPVVQGVMVLLALASVATWTVLLVRALALALAKDRLRRAIARIREAESLANAGAAVRRGLPVRLVAAAAEELDRSAGLPGEGIKERAQVALGRIEAAAAKRAASGTGILATVGSTGPFVGLFGTVWGIMHSFIGIAQAHTTNLAVVAPGIAEALLATGIGLVAAIPAVVIYNVLTRAVASYRALVSDAVALILCHLSRDLDRRAFAGLDHRHAALHIAAE